MDIGGNVLHLRKTILKLSREKFGERLGVSASEIKNIESGALARPELKEPLYNLMCREYGINYDWLMTGEGPMYPETKEDAIERFARENGYSIHITKFLKLYLSLEGDIKDAVDVYLNAMLNTYAEENAANNLEQAAGGGIIPLAAQSGASYKMEAAEEIAEADIDYEAEGDALAAKVKAEFLREKRTEQEASSFTSLKNTGTGNG